jgi:hypothetical protein
MLSFGMADVTIDLKDLKSESAEYLECGGKTYVLNKSGTLYQPKPGYGEAQCENGGAGKSKSSPLYVDTLPSWVPIIISALTLLFLIFTVIYARRQWLESNRAANSSEIAANAAQSAALTASQQLKLLKEQWEATQAAVVSMGYNDKRPELNFEDPLAPTDPRLTIWIRNSGHGNARDIHVEMTISVREISEESRVLFHVKKDITPPPLPPSEPEDNGPQFDFPNAIPKPDMVKVNNTEATLRIEGVIRYSNGIDKAQIQQPFCYSFIRYTNAAGFVQCFDFDNEVITARRRKSQAVNEN